MSAETPRGSDRPVLLVLASTYPRFPNDPEPGFVHALCRRLLGDFDVIALVPDAPGADPSGVLDGVEVIRYRYAPRRWETLVNMGGIATNLKRSPWKWLLVPGFMIVPYLIALRLRHRRRIDLIHAHWLLPQGLVAWALSGTTPYLVTSHGGDLFGLRGRIALALKRLVAKRASAMTVVSSAMREEAHAIGLAPPVLCVVPMGADLRARFVPSPDTARSDDTLLFVGRLVAKKGLDVLLDAMPAIVASRPRARLRIAGFGPEEASLRAQARRLGIEGNVEFLGAMAQDRLPDLYRTAALCVAPFVRDESGNQEGLPVVLMEAIGCGCPIVVGDVAGVRDLLGDGHAEVRVPPGDAGALARAVLDSLSDAARARERALEIRADVIARIDWENVAAAYARTLKDCLPDAGDARASRAD
ncbi:MAG TPA: glycosyltransferase [Rhodanobacteraceae bacterium]|nr:glycosyltransferase [Rhodanobacteraceae bacterium]